MRNKVAGDRRNVLTILKACFALPVLLLIQNTCMRADQASPNKPQVLVPSITTEDYPTRPNQKSAVHNIPLSECYEHYVHTIPLSKGYAKLVPAQESGIIQPRVLVKLKK
jgi:hypothetical protein